MPSPRPTRALVRKLWNQAIELKRANRALRVENANLRRVVGAKIARTA